MSLTPKHGAIKLHVPWKGNFLRFGYVGIIHGVHTTSLIVRHCFIPTLVNVVIVHCLAKRPGNGNSKIIRIFWFCLEKRLRYFKLTNLIDMV